MNGKMCNPKLVGSIGIIGALFFSAVWIIGVGADSSWSLGENTLSDMGISDVELTANVFNYGCMVAGVLFTLFGIGKSSIESGHNRTSGLLMILAGIFLVGIGYFHKGWGDGTEHLVFAYLFFLVLCISVLYSMAGDWDDGYRLTPAITGVITVVCLGCVFGTTLAMLEAMVVACALLWMLIQGVKILRIRKD